jgi:anti-anti-sigma regulatory factor
MIKIEKNEQFAVIIPEPEAIDASLAQEIEKRISGLYREGYSNYIFDFQTTKSLSSVGNTLIKKVDKLCKNENGILVVVTSNEDLVNSLDSLNIEDLAIMDTKEEAIEAIYLNDLENDFREEEDEANDEYGEENEAADYE